MEQLKKIGQIKPKKSVEIKKSRIGLGFEKLDRDIFDPEKSYPFVAESGIKWARLQSGWQKTERQKGVYDFAWLDKIVDKMIEIVKQLRKSKGLTQEQLVKLYNSSKSNIS